MDQETGNKGDQSRRAIIDAAYRLFVQQGYHGTSMRQIADDAGIALGGIYNHFSGKEAIFRAVIIAYHPFVSVIPQLETLTGETVEVLLRRAANLFVREMEREHGLLNLIFIELIELEGRHMSELVDEVLPFVLRFQERLMVQGPEQLRTGNAVSFFRSFMGIIVAYYAMNQLLAGTAVAQLGTPTIADMMDIYLHGLFIASDRS